MNRNWAFVRDGLNKNDILRVVKHIVRFDSEEDFKLALMYLKAHAEKDGIDSPAWFALMGTEGTLNIQSDLAAHLNWINRIPRTEARCFEAHGLIAPYALFNGNLAKAKFFMCDFRGASFKRTYLRDVSFHHCNLQNTDFTEANLFDAEFRFCDIRSAVFDRADVGRCSFVENLTKGASFKNVPDNFDIQVIERQTR